MVPPDRPLLSELGEDVAALATDLREFLALRLELARQELLADARSARRLVIGGAAAIVMALSALPLLMMAAAWWLDGRLGMSAAGWSTLFGVALLAIAIAAASFAWRRFRRELTGMAQSREELREDLVWLDEWSRRRPGK